MPWSIPINKCYGLVAVIRCIQLDRSIRACLPNDPAANLDMRSFDVIRRRRRPDVIDLVDLNKYTSVLFTKRTLTYPEVVVNALPSEIQTHAVVVVVVHVNFKHEIRNFKAVNQRIASEKCPIAADAVGVRCLADVATGTDDPSAVGAEELKNKK